MGYISQWPVEELKKEYGLEIAIETGTCTGHGAVTLASHNFKKVYTIEVLERHFKLLDFSHTPSIHALLGSSIDVLPGILKGNRNIPTFFWLDAHLPSHYGHRDNTRKDFKLVASRDKEIEFPLKRELELIVENKDVSRDVFVIDDIRIYEDGPFTSGLARGIARSPERGISFICDLFKKTHLITRDYRNEGFLILEPFIPQGAAQARSANLADWQELVE